jgi:hypothetical protein
MKAMELEANCTFLTHGMLYIYSYIGHWHRELDVIKRHW